MTDKVQKHRMTTEHSFLCLSIIRCLGSLDLKRPAPLTRYNVDQYSVFLISGFELTEAFGNSEVGQINNGCSFALRAFRAKMPFRITEDTTYRKLAVGTQNLPFCQIHAFLIRHLHEIHDLFRNGCFLEFWFDVAFDIPTP